MATQLPSQMKAILLPGPGESLEVKQVEIPEYDKNEVVVKLYASPINPSDLSFLTGKYTHIPSYPVVPGIEGSGVVVATGNSLMAKRMMGKKVICSPVGKGGTWAEYMVTDAMKCIPVPTGVELDKAAMMIVNPLTALSLIGFAKKNGHKGVVINAANSSLGKMMIRLCKKDGLACVAIVRNKAQVDALLQLGASRVLVSGGEDITESLRDILQQENVSYALDAITGEMTNVLLEALPFGGELKVYGRLAGVFPTINPKELVQNGKSMSGFYLGVHMQSLGIFKKLKLLSKAKKMIKNELQSNIAETVQLEDVNAAIERYKQNMSLGKILLKP